MLLVMAICIQINTIKAATSSVGTTLKDNSDLKDELLKLQGRYEAFYRELEKKEKELEEVRLNAAAKNETDTQNDAEIKSNQMLLGLTNVTGEGVIIKIDENREVKNNEVLNINGYLVHEEDLLYIVNELFNSGADAISINEQRVINTTSILCDGNIIRINGKMVGVPITIKAIGFPSRMEYALKRPGGYLQKMADDGVEIYTEKTENINIPKYEGVYSYEYLSRGDV
ncbi:MAG: DUF881 domain-containing protein [Clostridia bacterium]|nr:DUF881 domain-containing protein [Clostridia bacterium]